MKTEVETNLLLRADNSNAPIIWSVTQSSRNSNQATGLTSDRLQIENSRAQCSRLQANGQACASALSYS